MADSLNDIDIGRNRPVARNVHRLMLSAALMTLIIFSLVISNPLNAMEKVKIGILMASDIRNDPVNGFKSGMEDFSRHGGYDVVYSIRNAGNDKSRLPGLARELIAEKPGIAVAAGGIEADALKSAAEGTIIPIVFLSVASSINRGLASSMTAPDRNMTGVDTNDTTLTAKRLWFIKRILPEVRTVFCFHVPSIVPSVESIQVAREKAPQLGLTLIVEETETVADIRKATEKLSREHVDVILLNPVAPIHGEMKNTIYPKAMKEKIPIFGYGASCIDLGVFASYAGSRYANGRQAARLVHKIVNGTRPENIPIEIPEQYEFIINKWMVEALGIQLPQRAWKMADKIVDIQF